jgi:hypothetical protein
VAQWGPQEILSYDERWPHLLPRKRMTMLAGPPVDLEDLRTLPQNAQTLKEATDRIMDAITDLLAKLRGQAPPVVRFVPENGGNNLYGNNDGENDGATEGDRATDGDGDGETGKQVDTA